MTTGKECSTPVPVPAEGPADPGAPGADRPADPAALTIEQLATLLGMPVEKVRDHVADGSPTGPKGTINLVHYAAWLNRRLKEIDGD